MFFPIYRYSISCASVGEFVRVAGAKDDGVELVLDIGTDRVFFVDSAFFRTCRATGAFYDERAMGLVMELVLERGRGGQLRIWNEDVEREVVRTFQACQTEMMRGIVGEAW